MKNHDAEMAEQALHVAAMLIEKMRAALPGSGRHAGPAVKAETLTVAREHDQMVSSLIVALTPFVGKLDAEITLKTASPGKPGFVTVECKWGKVETSKSQNVETQPGAAVPHAKGPSE